MEATITQELQAAREALHIGRQRLARPYGWVRRAYEQHTRGGVGYCMTGALSGATCFMTAECSPRFFLNRAVEQLDPLWWKHNSPAGIEGWNDWTGRRKRQVLEAYDVAIELCEKKLAELGGLY